MDQSPQSPAARPGHASRTFSARSDKSAEPRSPSSAEQADKARRDSFLRGESKANPNAAIKEAEPGVRAALERTTLNSIRDLEHKDVNGVPIAEPDLCNPTRPRWERPLDTIRSFEKAIDGGYKRKSMARAESYDQNNQFASRRSSYFGGYDSGPSPPRHSQMGGGHYGGRRPESYYDGHGSQAPQSRQRYGRYASDGNVQRPHNSYGQHGHHQSHDTLNTGVTNGSDSTGPWHNSTDPSSENSSLDRAPGVRQPQTPEPSHGYGHDGFGAAPIMEEYGMEDGNGYSQPKPPRAPNGYANGSHSPQQYTQPTAPRQTIQLGGGGGPTDDYGSPVAKPGGHLPSNARPQEEKRKSWIKRRFSKRE